MILWVLVIVASVILDQITKLLVTGNMALYESVPVIPHVFSFTYIHNYGAAWGIFSEHRWIFIAITGIAIIVLPIFLYRYRNAISSLRLLQGSIKTCHVFSAYGDFPGKQSGYCICLCRNFGSKHNMGGGAYWLDSCGCSRNTVL